MVEQIARLIALRRIPTDVCQNDEILVSSLDLLSSLLERSEIGLRRSFVEVAIRALEMRLLADAELLNVSMFWDSYLGREREIIRSRLEVLLGTVAPTELVEHIRSCLESRVWVRSEKEPVAAAVVERLLLSYANRSVRKELRCEHCGYHFRRSDLGSERADHVAELGLHFASALHPLRQGDLLKPAFLKGRRGDVSLTTLTVDHVVPEAGFGWSTPDNLQIACQFCNQGRLAYRRATEALSATIAGSLSAVPDSRPHSLPRQVIVVSCIAASEGRCSTCGRGVDSVELSCSKRRAGDSSRDWLVPWNMEVSCYECGPLGSRAA